MFAKRLDALIEEHPNLQEELLNIKAHLYPNITQPPGQVYMINRVVTSAVKTLLRADGHTVVTNFVDASGDTFAVIVHAPYYEVYDGRL